MSTLATIGFAAAVLFAGWWWFVRRNQPDYEPLEIAPDDPLMQEAKAKARSSIDRFLELLERNPDAGTVKLPFVTSSGVTEFLWASVRSVEADALNVLYLTPPVTHTGEVERMKRHPVADLVDWMVELPDGRYAGGYTMRVMFVRGREQWGSLPRQLEAEERRYVEE